MWWNKHKWKIVAAAMAVAILAAAFWFGGNAPGATGLELLEKDLAPAMTDAVPPAMKPAQEPVQETPSEPAEIPTDAPTGEPTTEPVPEPTGETVPTPGDSPQPVEPQDAQIGVTAYTCTISISCATILDNMALCDPEKAGLVPEDGWILEPVTVTFYGGESVFNVLQRTCKERGIHMEYENTPVYNSAYIEGIHNLYALDVGELSGWMYQVNDWFPNYGCSRYQLQDGDVICWVYTCDLGGDVGGGCTTGGQSE